MKKVDWREHYFFLFDDFLLEVTKPTKAEKCKFIRKYDLMTTTVLEAKPDQLGVVLDGFASLTSNPLNKLRNTNFPFLVRNNICRSPDTVENALCLYEIPTAKKYLMKGKSIEEKNEWFDAIGNQISFGM